MICLISILSVTSYTCSGSHWSHSKSLSGGWITVFHSRRFLGITWRRLCTSASTQQPQDIFPNCSPRKHEILFCVKWPYQRTPSMKHSEVPIHASFILVSLDWLAKSMFHGFCKIQDAICQAWLLSAPTEQSRNGSGPTNHKWIAEVEAAEL